MECMRMFGIPREQSQRPRPKKGKEKQIPQRKYGVKNPDGPGKGKKWRFLVEDRRTAVESEPEVVVSEHSKVEDLVEILTRSSGFLISPTCHFRVKKLQKTFMAWSRFMCRAISRLTTYATDSLKSVR